MVARNASILIVAVFLTSAYAQDKPPREAAAPTRETAAATPTTNTQAPAGQVVNPVPGILLPTVVQQNGPVVFESPVYPPFKTCNLGGCKSGCCPKCSHCIHEIVTWLFYKPVPIPNYCRHCKHYMGGCTPVPMDFFVQRYGYYNWTMNCAPNGAPVAPENAPGQ